MNSDVIKLLPDSVANQIAAGEVIQRPASVVKELVENSVDAGATSIQIIIKDAGRTLIQVVDNGKGMTPTDARMAFERHATSKIVSATDLYTLHTMGFRGEALPSVAAVAQIELRTMRPGDTMGCCLRISESRFEGSEPCSCAPGTNLMVKNLFFHMPARRKFLKKDTVELSHILHEFERLALVNTNIDFTIIHNGVTLHSLLHSTLKQRISALFGKSIGSQIVPLATETPIVKLSGFTGLPHAAKRRGYQQFFFVNGRNMRHPYFHKAVMSCYEDLIGADVQPSYFINFEVDPATIDVNIHPQKHEIKFENEQPIWQILTAAVRQALGKVNAAGAIDFDSEDAIPDIPVFNPDADAQMPGIDTDPSYNPFDLGEGTPAAAPVTVETRSRGNAAPPVFTERRSGEVPRDWDKLYAAFESRRSSSGPDLTPPAVDDFRASHDETALPLDVDRSDNPQNITIDNRYVMIPVREGVLVVHRYRAHVRVLYDKFLKRLSEGNLPSQRLIFPETITLSPSQSTVLSGLGRLTESLGFDISFLGDNVWAINAAPSLPDSGNPTDTLTKMIEIIENSGEIPRDSLVAPAALALARSVAVNSLNKMSREETDLLIGRLLSSPECSFTPNGQKITYLISSDEIAKNF